MTVTYQIKNLDCAMCAQKLSAALSALPGVAYAHVDFASAVLTLDLAGDADLLLEQVRRTVFDLEPDVVLTPGAHARPLARDVVFSRSLTVKMVGAVLFVGGFVLEILTDVGAAVPDWAGIMLPYLFGVAALLLGHAVLTKLLGNLIHLKKIRAFFDENLLIALVAAVAFIAGEAAEGCAIVFFYQLGTLFQSLAVARCRARIVQLLAAHHAHDHDCDCAACGGESHPAHEHTPAPGTAGSLANANRAAETDAATTDHGGFHALPAETGVTRFARIYVPVMLVVALLLGAVAPLTLPFRHMDFTYWVPVALTALIVACPCALVLSIPMTYYAGLGAAAKYGVFLSHPGALDTLAKTGTLAASDGVLLAPDCLPTAIALAKRVRRVVVLNICLVFTLKIAMLGVSFVLPTLSPLVAEAADIGSALLCVLVAQTLLLVRPRA
jgi:Cd2+/Zn2+-exporting ATPase